MTVDTIAHWHVFAEIADGSYADRAFDEKLSEQQARDFADALAQLDEGTWDAVWVQSCPLGPRCGTFWERTAAFEADAAEPYWERAR